MDRFEDTVSSKEIFDLMYSRLKTLHDNFLGTVLKATSVFLLVTGWLVTSQTASNHLQADPVFKWLVGLGLTVYAFLFAIAAFRTNIHSAKVLQQLESLNYIDRIYFSDLKVSITLAATFALANWILVGAVIVYVVRLTS